MEWRFVHKSLNACDMSIVDSLWWSNLHSVRLLTTVDYHSCMIDISYGKAFWTCFIMHQWYEQIHLAKFIENDNEKLSAPNWFRLETVLECYTISKSRSSILEDFWRNCLTIFLSILRDNVKVNNKIKFPLTFLLNVYKWIVDRKLISSFAHHYKLESVRTWKQPFYSIFYFKSLCLHYHFRIGFENVSFRMTPMRF